MIDAARIRQQIDRDIFDYQQMLGCLASLRKPRDKIGRLLARGGIVRIRKGLYTFGEVYRRHPIHRELLANLVQGPSYVSLDYALRFYGLIPERVEAVTSVTTGRSRAFETPFGRFTYRRLRARQYAVGAMLESGRNASFLIASPEKSLVDKVWADKRFAGTSLSEVEPYLLDDLRVSPERLRSLNGGRLKAIGRACSSRKIRLLVRYLTSRV